MLWAGEWEGGLPPMALMGIFLRINRGREINSAQFQQWNRVIFLRTFPFPAFSSLLVHRGGFHGVGRCPLNCKAAPKKTYKRYPNGGFHRTPNVTKNKCRFVRHEWLQIFANIWSHWFKNIFLIAINHDFWSHFSHVACSLFVYYLYMHLPQ